MQNNVASKRNYPKSRFIKTLQNYKEYYLLLIPGIVFLIIFKLVPFAGNVLAFKEFDITLGNNIIDAVAKSPWVGLHNFQRLFIRSDSLNVVFNTLIITFYQTLFLFPIPILFAVMLNEIRCVLFKGAIQTIAYVPHFLSWVIVGAIFLQILQMDGIVNHMLAALNIEPVSFFIDNKFFRGVLVFTEGWKETGSVAIVYLAAIAGINVELYEAGTIDGCSRIQRIRYITIPSIATTIAMMFILYLGARIAFGSFEQVFMMYNPAVYKTGDIIQTFVYRMGLGQLDFSFSTAVGMLNSLTAFVLIFTTNSISKRVFAISLW
jgi:putative aldouronate transport system permease protein